MKASIATGVLWDIEVILSVNLVHVIYPELLTWNVKETVLAKYALNSNLAVLIVAILL
jgi:hypothetical protein